MAKALFKSMAMNAKQARACMKHNKRETVTESIKAVEHLVARGNEEVVYASYDDLVAEVKLLPSPPHGNSKIFREAVLTLNEEHGIEDLIVLGMKVQEELGFRPMYFFIHRDEGHVDPRTGAFIPNLHAHFGYTTLNFETVKVFPHGRDEMSKLQKLTAETLNMEPGQPVIESKRVGYDHKSWKVLKEAQAEVESLTLLVNQYKDHVSYLEGWLDDAEETMDGDLGKLCEPLEYYLDCVDGDAKSASSRQLRETYLDQHLSCLDKAKILLENMKRRYSKTSGDGGLSRMEGLADEICLDSDAEIQDKIEWMDQPPSLGKWETHDVLKNYSAYEAALKHPFQH